jgi:hypothetical protein
MPEVLPGRGEGLLCFRYRLIAEKREEPLVTVRRSTKPCGLRFHARAKLLVALDSRAYLRAPVSFPASEIELFFDIEIDPTRISVIPDPGSNSGKHRLLALHEAGGIDPG